MPSRHPRRLSTSSSSSKCTYRLHHLRACFRFSAECSIKSRKFLIDDRKQLIRSCRTVESEMERCVSSARSDSLIASARSDSLIASARSDSLIASARSDSLIASARSDSLIASARSDSLIASARSDSLIASARSDSLIASATQEFGDTLIPELNLQSATANTEGSFAATKLDLQQ